MPVPPVFPWTWLLLGLSAWFSDGRRGESRAPAEDSFSAARARMVSEQIAGRQVTDPAVLAAMGEVERHLFVPPDQIDHAYEDRPLPIGQGQTISQPYIVAFMTELVRPKRTDRALEVGTGCGYQTAVLSRVVRHVYTIEIVEALAAGASARLARLGYSNVTTRVGDGYQGWPSEAPFEVIVVTAAPEQVPQALVDQLAKGGRLVIPVGATLEQNLELVEKDLAGRIHTRVVAPVRFVPMIKKGVER
jgi:protein-L-isoaspartate(D-aspartate) O-methyltransferase